MILVILLVLLHISLTPLPKLRAEFFAMIPKRSTTSLELEQLFVSSLTSMDILSIYTTNISHSTKSQTNSFLSLIQGIALF